VFYKTLLIDGLNIAYREAGDPAAPKLVLLPGFPSSSHQYRNLIPALADRFHVISPDYPGFGSSDIPDPASFRYTFDKLANLIGHFLEQKGFARFGLYAQDYGGPIGFRIITQKPDALEWLIIQNSNAYEVGFTEAWARLRNALWHHRTAENEAAIADLLEVTTVMFRGQDDVFFIGEDGEAYLADLPNAGMQRLDASHFAVEDGLSYIAKHIYRFYDEVVIPKRASKKGASK
jgi:pimeloyl-ACP methyl ester carboxylesterase